MIIEIISTGEEVLSGQIVDTNAAAISSFLIENDFEVNIRFTVGDRLPDLVSLFLERSKSADVVIVTGGLGPTSDDLSAEAMAQAKNEPLRLHEIWWHELERRFQENARKLDPQNKKQATLPSSATIIDNPIGTACGFMIQLNRAEFYFLPGVPSEMKKMLQDQIVPRLMRNRGNREKIDLEVFQTFGIPESRLGRKLDTIVLPKSVKLGYRPRLGMVEVKMLCKGASEGERAHVRTQIRHLLGPFIYSEKSENLAKTVYHLLLARGETLSVAESCTGGMLASALVDIPGSSKVFDRGYVTYSNQAKIDLLQVSPEVLFEKGAVSGEVVCQMAIQARVNSKTNYALAISGVAGPEGGTKEKPVGTVVFALSTAKEIFCQTLILPSFGRNTIREVSALVALDMLRRHLTSLPVVAEYDYATIKLR